MAVSLSQMLRQMKTGLNERGLFRKETSQLLPDGLKFADLKKMAKRLAALANKDLQRLMSDQKTYGDKINAYSIELREAKKKLKEIEKSLELKKDPKGYEKKYRDIEKILGTLPIVHVEFLEPATTVFTTTLLKRGNQVYGIYRIWIDWAKSTHSNGIKVLNVYKSYGDYDHPCISRGNLCEGNASPTLKKYYESGDVYSLVEAIIGFIVSQDVSAGYIRSWDAWLKSSQRVKQRDFRQLGFSPTSLSASVTELETQFDGEDFEVTELPPQARAFAY